MYRTQHRLTPTYRPLLSPEGGYTRGDAPPLSFIEFRQRHPDVTLVAAAGVDGGAERVAVVQHAGERLAFSAMTFSSMVSLATRR